MGKKLQIRHLWSRQPRIDTYNLVAAFARAHGLDQETSGYTATRETSTRGVLPQHGSSASNFMLH